MPIKLNIGPKLMAVFLAIGILPAAAVGFLALKEASTGLEEQAINQLISVRDIKAQAIRNYLGTVTGQVRTLTRNAMVAASLGLLSRYYHEYAEEQELNPELTASQRQAMGDFYRDRFAARYRELSGGQAPDPAQLAAALSPTAAALQFHYLQANANSLGAKDQLDIAEDGSSYSDEHLELHPTMRSFVEEFGFYDLFLISPEGEVVYSVEKESDFATSLVDGPWRESGLAEAYRRALAAEDGQVVITDFTPYAPAYEAPASFVAAPLYRTRGVSGTRRLLGVIAVQFPVDRLNAIMAGRSGLGESGETYLVGPDLLMRSDSFRDPEGHRVAASFRDPGRGRAETPAVRRALNGEEGSEIITTYDGKEVLSAYLPLAFGELRWALLAEMEVVEAFAAVAKLRTELALLSLLSLLLIVAAAWFMAGNVTRPILRLRAAVETAAGDYDLRQRFDVATGDEIQEMAFALDRMLTNFRGTVAENLGGAARLAAAAEQLAAVNEETNQGIGRQQAATRQVMEAINGMSASVQEVARNASLAAAATADADQQAGLGRQVVERTLNAIGQVSDEVQAAAGVIGRLAEHSGNISQVLEVIRGISDQTNLLALNAAIEAARAGDAGRGFAVVADEVRGLARRTQQSTEEIQAMIEELQGGADEAVRVMEVGRGRADAAVEQAGETGRALRQIADAVTRAAQMNRQIAAAAERQSATAEEIKRSVDSIGAVAEQTLQGSSQASASSEQLAQLAAQQQELLGKFKV